MDRPDRPREWRVIAGIALGALVVIVLGVVTLAFVVREATGPDRIECEGYEFDRAEWIDDAGQDESKERQADALVRCRTLIGMTRKGVRQLLGDNDRRAGTSTHRRWWFYTGEVNDFLGPGDALILYVRFDGTGTVKRTSLSQRVDR
jgi:hypothetical protein